jgi:hypothetical protein
MKKRGTSEIKKRERQYFDPIHKLYIENAEESANISRIEAKIKDYENAKKMEVQKQPTKRGIPGEKAQRKEEDEKRPEKERKPIIMNWKSHVNLGYSDGTQMSSSSRMNLALRKLLGNEAKARKKGLNVSTNYDKLKSENKLMSQKNKKDHISQMFHSMRFSHSTPSSHNYQTFRNKNNQCAFIYLFLFSF